MFKKSKIFTILFLLFAIFSILRTVFLLWNSYLPDFSVYYDSALLLMTQKNPYINSRLFTQINYPPMAMILWSPLLLFPFPIAAKMWILASITTFIITLILLYLIKPIPFAKLSLIIFATAISFPFKFTYGMGQVNFFLLFLFSFFLFLMTKKKDLLISVSLSLAIIIKLFPIFFLFPMLSLKKWKAFLLTCFILLVSIIISIILVGEKINFYYLEKILIPLLSESAGGVYYNQSLTGTLSRLNVYPILINTIRIAIVIVSLSFALRYKKNIFLSFSIILVMILLVNNFTWQHHLILLLLPYYLIISHKLSKRILFASIISYLLIAINIKNPELISQLFLGNLILSHGSLGMFILWFLLLLKKSKKKI